MARRRDVWVAIARAARAGRGIRLSADEVGLLGFDDAVASAAETCTAECVCDVQRNGGQCLYCENKEEEKHEV